jgi:hypothetical protein
LKKPVKIVLGLATGLVILLVAACIVGLVFVDSIAREGIQAGATYALGVNTTLDKASVGVVSGKFSMNGLKVDNPKGFDGKFLSLGNGGVAVSLGSLTSDTVVLPKFQLTDVEMDLERGSSGANYQIILDNLKKLESGKKSQEPASKSEKKFKINEISIKNVVVHVDMLGGPGGVTKLNVPIDEIKLTNVGSDGSGVDIPKLTAIVLQAILAAAVEKGGGLIPADISNELKGGLQQLSGLANVGVEAVGKAGEQVTKIGGVLGKDVQKGVQDVGDQLKKGIGDLIPGAKKPEKTPDK